MLEFLLALLTTATVGALLVPLMRARAAATSRLDNDLAIYRDQLAEIARERAAGTLSEAEAAQATTEIERRILTAADRATATATTDAAAPDGGRFLVPVLCLAIPLFALGIYLQVGRPGLPAVPFAERAAPHTEDGTQDLPAMIAAARARVAAQPDDAQAWSVLGEMLTVEAQGAVTRSAHEAFTRAAALDADDPRTVFYLGLHEAQSGDSRAALARWQALANRAPADAPWLPTLRAEIERVAKAAGLPVPEIKTPAPAAGGPASGRGPTREQVEAMQSLAPEQRQQAIRSMVEGLAARLIDTPNDRDGWLRLATARKVLGENDQAAEAFARADALQPLDPRQLVDWAEALVRQIAPGQPPSPQAVAVLTRLEAAEPRNALALFYLGAASLAAGDKQAAARRWKTLLALLPADAPIRGMLEERIRETE